MSAILTCIS